MDEGPGWALVASRNRIPRLYRWVHEGSIGTESGDIGKVKQEKKDFRWEEVDLIVQRRHGEVGQPTESRQANCSRWRRQYNPNHLNEPHVTGSDEADIDCEALKMSS